MDEEMELYDVGFMLSRSKRRSYRESIIRMFNTYLRFLQDHNLTTRLLLEPNEVPSENTIVKRKDLTDEGWEFIKLGQDKWFSAVDRGTSPENVSILEKTLSKIRNKNK